MKTEQKLSRKTQSAIRNSLCVACGSEIERETAKYCLVCGKVLSEDYQPLDSLRSSNRMQGKSFLLENEKNDEDLIDVFEINRNPVSEFAWASCVYSMVPFLGVLFIPLTFVTALIGFRVARRNPKLGGKKLSVMSMGLSVPILGAQVIVWWLLYIVPDLARGV